MDENSKLMVQDWSPDQEIDANLPHVHRNVHVKSIMLNNRFYIFQNVAPSNPKTIKVIDPSL